MNPEKFPKKFRLMSHIVCLCKPGTIRWCLCRERVLGSTEFTPLQKNGICTLTIIEAKRFGYKDRAIRKNGKRRTFWRSRAENGVLYFMRPIANMKRRKS